MMMMETAAVVVVLAVGGGIDDEGFVENDNGSFIRRAPSANGQTF